MSNLSIDALFAADANGEEFIDFSGNPKASLEDIALRILYEEAAREKVAVANSSDSSPDIEALNKLVDVYCRRSKLRITNIMSHYRKLDGPAKSFGMGKAIRANLKFMRLEGAKSAKIYAENLKVNSKEIISLIATISMAVGETAKDQ